MSMNKPAFARLVASLTALTLAAPALAQQNGSAVAEHRKAAKLVTCISLCDRSRTTWEILTGENGRSVFRREAI